MLPNAQNDHVLMSEHAYYDRSDTASSIVSPQYQGPVILGALILSICLGKLGYTLLRRSRAAKKPTPKSMADQLV